MQQKRYEYWASEKGIATKKWSEWFNYDGPREPRQLGNKLKNEYREI